jgi:hypothetical protein
MRHAAVKLMRGREAFVWCCLCFDKKEPATVDWPGVPLCRHHFKELRGSEETPEGAAYAALKSHPA